MPFELAVRTEGRREQLLGSRMRSPATSGMMRPLTEEDVATGGKNLPMPDQHRENPARFPRGRALSLARLELPEPFSKQTGTKANIITNIKILTQNNDKEKDKYLCNVGRRRHPDRGRWNPRRARSGRWFTLTGWCRSRVGRLRCSNIGRIAYVKRKVSARLIHSLD